MKKSIFCILLILTAICSMADDKLVGGDISMLSRYEAANVNYYDRDGKKISNLLDYFRNEAGFNIARVRLFVEPTGETGVIQDLEYVKALSKKIKEAGLLLMLDFHYSDTWADPSNQWTPTSWVAYSEQELPQVIYNYTKDALEELINAGIIPDYIQTGNEISYGMLWGPKGTKKYNCHYDNDANWERFIRLLTMAGNACREVCPEAKIIIHTERTNNWNGTQKIYNRLSVLDYDIIGLSYYPEWHNSLTALKNTLNNVHSVFTDKKVMIVETGYYNNWYRSDATYDFQSTWPASPEGQKAFLDQLVEVVKDMDFMTGILYWFPEENPFNNHVYEPWYNHGLFNPNTGKVSDALFSLKALNKVTTDVEMSHITTDEGIIYTIDGRIVTDAENLSHGIYIQNAHKIVK